MSLIPEDVCDLANKTVLLVWGSGINPEDLKNVSDQLSGLKCREVVVENAERLIMCKNLLISSILCYLDITSIYFFIFQLLIKALHLM